MLLEQLTHAERAAYILREAFDYHTVTSRTFFGSKRPTRGKW